MNTSDLQEMQETIETIAPTDVTVLITGESGTGKEVLADEIYNKSNRKDNSFIKVNCAAIPSELLESELFGYEGGSFTGANKNGKIGLFELASGGTLLLDEIGDLPLALQAKLLPAIQQKEIRRVGGTTPIKLDVRLITAMNKNLSEEVKANRFREDLYCRINVVPLEIPPLRKRPSIIDVLSTQFLTSFNKKYNKNVTFDFGVTSILKSYHWPGNIRELENLIERLVVINTSGPISIQSIYGTLNIQPLNAMNGMPDLEECSLKDMLLIVEKDYLMHALQKYKSKRQAAAALGMSHSTFLEKLKKYDIPPL